MAYKKHDIVYILKNDIEDTEELRYSLRSVEQNFYYRRVWFAGGQPEGFLPDERLPYEQPPGNRYVKVCSTIRAICKCDEITDDFWLFNDDFFIIEKCEKPVTYYLGDLYERAARIRKALHQPSAYTAQLIRTAQALEQAGYGIADYSIHVPMLINKEKALAVLDKYSTRVSFRSAYGNMHVVGGERLQHDAKISGLDVEPDPDDAFLSTSELSFANGKVGEYIRSQFPDPSKWEVE